MTAISKSFVRKGILSLVTIACTFSTTTAKADFEILSRHSEVELATTNLGGVAEFATTSNAADIFDVQFSDAATHIEPGGAINSGIWVGSQRSSTTENLIQANMHSEVHVQQVFQMGSGLLTFRNEFEVDFVVSESTDIELGGSMFGSADLGTADFVRLRFQQFNGVTFLNMFVTTTTDDLDTPFTATLQPGTTYRLLVESYAAVMGMESSASGINVCLRPQAILGDINQDGIVNLLDVDPFIEAISTGTYQVEADTNCDGAVNLLDVEAFVNILAGG